MQHDESPCVTSAVYRGALEGGCCERVFIVRFSEKDQLGVGSDTGIRLGYGVILGWWTFRGWVLASLQGEDILLGLCGGMWN